MKQEGHSVHTSFSITIIYKYHMNISYLRAGIIHAVLHTDNSYTLSGGTLILINTC